MLLILSYYSGLMLERQTAPPDCLRSGIEDHLRELGEDELTLASRKVSLWG